MVVIKSKSKTARDISGVGKSQVTQTSSTTSGGGGGGSREKTVAVNPLTYEPDPNSTFRVPESQVRYSSSSSSSSSGGVSAGVSPDSTQTKTLSSSSTSRNNINPLVKALIRGEISKEDYVAGRAKSLAGVSVSGPLAGKIAATGDKPMSIREDVNYQYKDGFIVRDKNIKPSVRSKGSSSNILFEDTTKKNVAKDFGTGLKSSIVDPVVSVAKGAGKIIKFEAENPVTWGSINPELVKKSEEQRKIKNEKFKELVKSDSDVRSTLFAGGLLATYPISSVPLTVAGTAQSVKGLYNVGTGLYSKDFVKVGEGTGDVLTGELTVKSFKRPFVELTKTKVRAEDIFGGEVSGRKVTSTSTKEALGQFEVGRLASGKLEVVSASPSSLTGGKLVDIGAGPKGAAGLEDPGAFVGPKTRANLKFTGLGKEGGDSSLTVNPVTEVKRFFGKSPVVSTIIVDDVVVPGKSVLAKPGFTSVNKQFVGEGVAVITKRSMIGKGEVTSQLFSPVQDFTSKGGMVRLKGNLYREAGTRESEAVIPRGSVLRKVSNKEFTVVNQKKFFGKDVPLTGDLIELPKYELVSGKKSLSKSTKGEKLFDAKDVGLIDSSSQSSFKSGRKRSLFSEVGSYDKSNIASSESFLSTKNSFGSRGSSSNGFGSSLVSGLSAKSLSSGSDGVVDSGSSVFSGSSIRSIGKTSSLVSGGKSTSTISQVMSGSLKSGSSLQGVSLSSGKTSFSPSFENGFKRRQGESLFSVEVRSLGRFKKVGEGVNLQDAIKLGKGVTGGSAARSFKIKTQAGKSLQGLDIGKDYYKKGDTYIEKVGVAINTGGELSAITRKGIASSKRKRGLVNF